MAHGEQVSLGWLYTVADELNTMALIWQVCFACKRQTVPVTLV
jgi:hypothetical protein